MPAISSLAAARAARMAGRVSAQARNVRRCIRIPVYLARMCDPILMQDAAGDRRAVAARARRCQWPGSRGDFVATRGLTVQLEDPSYASLGTGCRASDHLWSSDDARSESFERSNSKIHRTPRWERD